MDVVDVLLIVVVVAAAIHGLRLGALVQVFTFGGFLLGLTLGALLSTVVVSGIHSQGVRSVVSLALVLGMAIILGVGGRMLGGWSYAAMRRLRLGSVDSILGVVVAVVAVLVSAWLLATVVSNSRFTWLNNQVEQSDILHAVDAVLPPVPSVFARVQSFLSAEGFPPVFVDITPPAAQPVAVPTSARANAIGGPASMSTVKIVGQACGDLQEGSGFVVGPGLVVTNAHVIAGETLTEIQVGHLGYRARPVLFDPNFDLAVLRTNAPLGPPIAIASSTVQRGTTGAVVGYPEDGPLAITPAGVTASLDAEGRDIYNNGLVTRTIYELDADILPGNSGGPLIDPDGQVIGVVFSRSTVSANVGYALASPGVLQRVDEADFRTKTVSTGPCISD